MHSVRRLVWAGVVATLVVSAMVLGAFGGNPNAGASGLAWSIVAAGGITSGSFSGVTCASESDCWAVGGTTSGGLGVTATEHWTGSSWSGVSSPNTNAQFSDLINVSCVDTADCWAVGTSGNTNGLSEATLAEHWDGTAWSIVSTPNPTAEVNQLIGVACVNAADCWAVGNERPIGGQDGTSALVEHWDGSEWSLVPTPAASATDSDLDAVTCISSADCWAVGIAGLAEHWDGSSWSIVATPNQSSAVELLGVSCTSSSDCWAVGDSGIGSPVTLTEHWDGSAWSIVASPNPSPSDQNYLSGVDCLSISDCWASGYSVVAGHSDDTLIEQWDGSAWSIVATPDTSATQNILAGMACPSSSDCWAVGNADTQTLIEHGTSSALPTATTLTSSNDPARIGQSVTYTATVGVIPPGTGSPTGNVSFSDDSVPISGCDAVVVSAQKATCTVTYPRTGSHDIVATYSGDDNFSASASPPLGEAVISCLFATFGCDLAGANLENADLAGAIYVGANFSRGDLAGADLEDITLLFTTLAQADLAGADLRGAKLALVNLGHADLANANLEGATMFGVNLSGVNWANTICPDGSNSTLDGGTCLAHL